MDSEEQALEPERPIIDPHLHFWDILPAPGSLQAPQRFLFPECLATIAASGHNITHTVFVEVSQMYRQDGPPEMRCVGETEFVTGIAAMSDSGNYGPARHACRIVGGADLRLGARVRPVIEAHVAAAGGRFRGIRMGLVYSDQGLFGFPCEPQVRGIMLTPGFREGARVLAEMGLSLDVWCVHTQLGELAALADALPDLVIVLDHVGTPEATGAWRGREAGALAEWAAAITELAKRPNVRVKIGGMGMDLSGAIPAGTGTESSTALAAQWRPRVETCIAAFGPERAMFESNFPPDKAAGSYGATWNAFKRIARDYAEEEKDRLFRGTAAETYRI
ncbi:MAG: amidohydrolase family protein [Novosphingobium sp.]|jgi:predicted TIM-barrel fold metal-dependent hydrolase|nr:amidohydrolase family protein [Novosphingobium sp.]